MRPQRPSDYARGGHRDRRDPRPVSVSAYDGFARFYDATMGDGAVNSGLIMAAVERWRPQSSSLLELGCGTGSVLAGLDAMASLTGIDASPAMLVVAGDKVPRARLLQGDIAQFQLNERFDVVACVFDTLNHLTTFAQWVTCLECVAQHLEPGGLFIFDVNTTGRLAELVDSPPWVVRVNGSTLTMTVVNAGHSLVTWQIEVQERTDDGGTRTTLERVQELGVELDMIRSALSADFEVLDEDDGLGDRPDDQSPRAHIVCRLRDH